MSNERAAQAAWHGWEGPFFPEGVDTLQGVYTSEHPPIDSTLLGEVGTRFGSAFSLTQPRTADGYLWFAAIQVWYAGCEIALCLPWCRDEAMHDGTTTDRAIALYSKGTLSQDDLEHFVACAARHFAEVLRERAAAAAKVSARRGTKSKAA